MSSVHNWDIYKFRLERKTFLYGFKQLSIKARSALFDLIGKARTRGTALMCAVRHICEFTSAAGTHMNLPASSLHFEALRRRMTQLIVAMIAVSALTACGGGGGKANDDVVDKAGEDERDRTNPYATDHHNGSQYTSINFDNRTYHHTEIQSITSDNRTYVMNIFNVDNGRNNPPASAHSGESDDGGGRTTAGGDSSVTGTARRVDTGVGGCVVSGDASVVESVVRDLNVGVNTATDEGENERDGANAFSHRMAGEDARSVVSGDDASVVESVARDLDVGVNTATDEGENERDGANAFSHHMAGEDARSVVSGDDASVVESVARGLDVGVNTATDEGENERDGANAYVISHHMAGQYVGTTLDNPTFTMAILNTGKFYARYSSVENPAHAAGGVVVGYLVDCDGSSGRGIIYPIGEGKSAAEVVLSCSYRHKFSYSLGLKIATLLGSQAWGWLWQSSDSSSQGISASVLARPQSFLSEISARLSFRRNAPSLPGISDSLLAKAPKQLLSQLRNLLLSERFLDVTVSPAYMEPFQLNGRSNEVSDTTPTAAVSGSFNGASFTWPDADGTNMQTRNLALQIDEQGDINGHESLCQFEGRIRLNPHAMGNVYDIGVRYSGDESCPYPNNTAASGIGLLFDSGREFYAIMQTPRNAGIFFQGNRQ
ncbi:hypothetical protein DFQ28_010970 [Apophysomyces sp. BC1034]|nr:hypothetical protein DFQ28_010970 [Apophysomyces sp. BC1034]